MSLKATINYSPNFDIKKRPKKSIKFLVFHYTGMRSEKEAIKKAISAPIKFIAEHP